MYVWPSQVAACEISSETHQSTVNVLSYVLQALMPFKNIRLVLLKFYVINFPFLHKIFCPKVVFHVKRLHLLSQSLDGSMFRKGNKLLI